MFTNTLTDLGSIPSTSTMTARRARAPRGRHLSGGPRSGVREAVTLAGCSMATSVHPSDTGALGVELSGVDSRPSTSSDGSRVETEIERESAGVSA